LDNTITLEKALNETNCIWVDVRSPVEFAAGHIPGAINVPLFSDNERSEVGIIYKNIGQSDAKTHGLSIVSPKLPSMISQIGELVPPDGSVIVYCWRGGMRSQSIVHILNMMNIPANQLIGGYKAHRRYVLNSLEQINFPGPMVVFSGSTGIGKTLLLNLLANRGFPVIDLEGLANHRGSVFGQVGLGTSTTTPNFEAGLLCKLQEFHLSPYLLVECESKRIGKAYIPDIFYQEMQKGKKILIEASIEKRVNRLMLEYLDLSETNRQEIINSLQTLNNRLGKKKIASLLDAFSANKVEEVIMTLLTDYYDPLYGYHKTDKSKFDLVVNADDLNQAAVKIADYLNKLGGDAFGNGG